MDTKKAVVTTLALLMVISTAVSGILPQAVSAEEAGNSIKSHEVWDPDSSVLTWVPGQPKGYAEGETAAFRVTLGSTSSPVIAGSVLTFQIHLDLDDSGAYAFTDIESWDTTYQQDGTHLTSPPTAGALTGDVQGVNAQNAVISSVVFLGEEGGRAPENYQCWEITLTVQTSGIVYVVYGGHIAAPGDSIRSGGTVPDGEGASKISGVFQARISSIGTGDKTVNFKGDLIAPVVPFIQVVKAGPSTALIGETITYTYNVTNTGTVPLTNVGVVDDIAGQATPVGGDANNDKLLDDPLPPSAYWLFTVDYTVLGGDPDPLVNVANASGLYGELEVFSTDSWSVDLLQAAIDLTKTADKADAAVGETVTYTFKVVNTGSANLSNIQWEDSLGLTPVFSAAATATFGDDDGDAVFEPGETWLFTASRVVQLGDNDPLDNTATVNATDGYNLVSDTDSASVGLIYDPSINVDKEAYDSSDVNIDSANVGEEITWKIEVTLGGDLTPVTITSIKDNYYGSIPGASFMKTGGNTDNVLEAGETWSFEYAYIVPYEAGDSLSNMVTVTGVDNDGDTVTGTDTDTVLIDFAPVLEITKTPDQSSAVVGDTITYTIEVKHAADSDMSNVSNVVVFDSLADANLVLVSGDANSDSKLNAGETWTYSFDYLVIVSSPDPVNNNVTVNGVDNDDEAIPEDSAEASVPLGFSPQIIVDKTGPATASVGDEVNYTITVIIDTVNGDQSDVYNLTMTDPLGTPDYLSGDDGDGILELGETWTYYMLYTIQAGDLDPLPNTATATGDDRDGDVVSDSDDHSLAVSFGPMIDISKTANVTTAKIGDVIHYTIVVQHAPDSDGSPIFNVTVTDSLRGTLTTVTKTGGDQDDILEAGETWTYQYDRQVLANDLDPLVNVANVTGEDNDGDEVTDEDEETIPIEYNPVLLVTKTGPDSASIGDTITYTITVQHDPASDGSNIYNVTVSDILGITPIYVNGDDGDGILELGEVWTYTVEYTIQAGDPDPLVNTAIATGEDEDGDEVRDEDDEEVLIEHNPIIEVTKQANVTSAKVGDTILYTIVVQHASGSDGSDISNVTVSDVFGITPIYGGGDDGDGLLEAGEVWTYTVEYTVQAGDANPLTNIAIVTGEDKDGDEVTDDDEETIPIEEEVCPRLCVDKTGPAYAYVGDTITYTFYVYNTGDVPLSDVTVTDSITGVATYQSGDDNGNGLLDVNEVWVFADTWVTQETPDPLRNTAIATGYYGDIPMTDDDDHCLDICKIEPEQPGICLDKVGPACAYVGDTITYTFKVYNVGNVPLSSVTVVDSLTGEATYKSGDTNNDGMLDVDEVWVFTSSWVVGDSPDPLRNNAIATGFFGDVAYTAEDDLCVDVYQVVDENTEDVVDNADIGSPNDNAGASTNDPQDATTRAETGSGASFPWVLLIVGLIGAAVTLAAMAIYRRRSS